MDWRASALLFVTMFSVVVNASTVTTLASGPASADQWPTTLTVTVGDIRTRIESSKNWTMSGLDYQGNMMATEDSAYGTVISIRGAGFLGTGHFLDVPGKPGQVEKENVMELRFFLDNKPVTDFQPKMSISGSSFRMGRKSKIRALDLESTVLIRDGVVVETAHLHATKPIDLETAYPLMYAWTPKATNYLFGDDNGIQKRGTFRKIGEKANEGLEKNSRWMAVFDPASGKGSVLYLLQHPKDAEGSLQWTDAPGVYRKLRIMSFSNKVMPEGFDGTFQSAVGFFAAGVSDWEDAAVRRVSEVKSVVSNLHQP